MEERPKCYNEECSNEGFIMMFGKWFCGKCVAKWHEQNSEKGLNKLIEDINGN
ncbi:MAG: hypothetical protein ACTSPI_13795 [Candidatus Heimdallarchaeaceae archaeon]